MNPLSLLVPINTEAEFTCQAYCISQCDIYWIINNVTANTHHKPNFERRGFVFNHESSPANHSYTARIAVTALQSLNQTEFYCYVILDGDSFASNTAKSSTAVLLVIEGIQLGCNLHSKNSI